LFTAPFASSSEGDEPPLVAESSGSHEAGVVSGWIFDTSRGEPLRGLELELRLRGSSTALQRAISGDAGEFSFVVDLGSTVFESPTELKLLCHAGVELEIAHGRIWISRRFPNPAPITVRASTSFVNVFGTVSDEESLGLPRIIVGGLRGETSISDSNGRFQFRAACWGDRVAIHYGRNVHGEGLVGKYAEIRLTDDQLREQRIEGVVLRLPRTSGKIYVTAMYLGVPVPSSFCTVSGICGTFRANTSGIIEVPRLRSGAMNAQVGADGFLLREVQLPDQLQSLEVELDPCFSVPLAILLPDGSPAVGAEILAGSGVMKGPDLGGFVADEEGCVQIPVRSTTLTLSIEVPGQGAGEFVLDIEASGDSHRTVQLDPMGSISGQILTPSNTPAIGAIVTATRLDRFAGHPILVRANVEGYFEFACSGYGIYRIRCSFPRMQTSVFDERAGAHQAIQLTPAAFVNLKLVERNGTPLPQGEAILEFFSVGSSGPGTLLDRVRLQIRDSGLVCYRVARISFGEKCRVRVSVPGFGDATIVAIGGTADDQPVVAHFY
jgi:hypothetical protein